MPQSFEGKVIIITGAGSGIGRATAIKLASLGATLALTDINETSLAETFSLCEAHDHFISAFDVGSTEPCNIFIASIIQKYARINHVFNCAGINPTSVCFNSTSCLNIFHDPSIFLYAVSRKLNQSLPPKNPR
jgi:NAD(P)-dependent dehydrogenase (short-subunit alcohol dehydrogenase family)